MVLLNNRLEVYDLAYNKLCILNDNTESSAKNIEENLKLNSVNKVSFVLPLSSDKWQYVLNENLVRWKGEYYFIKVPHFTHNDATKEVSVECHHLSNGLEGITCPELELIGKSANELMTEVLNGTGWTVGTVDVPTDKFRSLITKEQSAFTNLVKVAELFEGTLTFNSLARTVDLSDKSENRNIQIRKGKNLQSVDIEYDTTEMTTRLYAFGGDDPDTNLIVNIMGVNPTGKSYIEDFSYYSAQGYNQAYIDAHPELFRREMTWNANEYVDSQALFDDAVSKLKTLCKPKVKCSVEGLDLSVFPEYFIESPIIGETIYVLDEDLGLVIDAKVTEIKRQNDKPLSLKITISNEVEYNSIVKQLVDSSQTVTKVVNPNNEIRGQFIKARTYMDRGELVPDDVTEAMVEERLTRPDARAGFVLDGFPRTLPQAEALIDILAQLHRQLTSVLYINVADQEIVTRLGGRRICRSCQAPYHLTFKPPA
jgi:phage minor structural protein